MVEAPFEPQLKSSKPRIDPDTPRLSELLEHDLDREFARAGTRWSRAFWVIAWIHLAVFLGCQALNDPKLPRDPRVTVLWLVEFVAILIALRTIVGRKWWQHSTSIRLASRFWATFLILSFNLVMLNELTGWDLRWYKPAWGTLSTFFLASMAWLFTPRFFIAAVQMYFTALLMFRFKNFDNLIYGTSWWLILMAIAYSISLREKRVLSHGPS
jgi:hypothetical protein